jgi:hypothetical protein
MRKRELDCIAVTRLRVWLPAARLLATLVPLRVESKALRIDARNADDAP